MIINTRNVDNRQLAVVFRETTILEVDRFSDCLFRIY